MARLIRNTLLVLGGVYLAGSFIDSAMYDIYQKEHQRKALLNYQSVKSPTARQSITEWAADKYIHQVYGNIETVNLAEGESKNPNLATKLGDAVASITENASEKANAGVCLAGLAGLLLLIRRMTKTQLH